MKKDSLKRLFAGLLAAALVFEGMSVNTLAADFYDESDVISEEIITEADESNIISEETTVDLDEINAEAGDQINLTEAFPDEVFRSIVATRINYTDVTYTTPVSVDVFKGTTSLSSNRKGLGTSVIKDITGIEYFTDLTSISFENHEISDISCIKNLKKLTAVNLKGNEITDIPDFSDSGLVHIWLDQNMISANNIKSVRNKLPKTCIMDDDCQRVGGLRLVAEDVYYKNLTTVSQETYVPIYAEVYGVKEGLITNITSTPANGQVRVYIDGVLNGNYKCNSKPVDGPLNIVANEASANDLTVGSHTLKVEVLNEKGEYEAVSKTFEVKEYKSFLAIMPNLSSYEDDEYSAYFSILNQTKKLKDIQLLKNGNIVDTGYSYSFGISNVSHGEKNPAYPNTNYTDFPVVSESILFKREKMTERFYDVKAIYKDDTEEIFENGFDTEKTYAYINEISSTTEYVNNMGEYVYLEIRGYNLDPAKLDYKFYCNGYELGADYVASKRYKRYYVVKFKKIGDWSFVGTDRDNPTTGLASCEISAKPGYDCVIYNNADWIDMCFKGINSFDYNGAKKQFEVYMPGIKQSEIKELSLQYATVQDYNENYPDTKKTNVSYSMEYDAANDMYYIKPNAMKAGAYYLTLSLNNGADISGCDNMEKVISNDETYNHNGNYSSNCRYSDQIPVYANFTNKLNYFATKTVDKIIIKDKNHLPLSLKIYKRSGVKQCGNTITISEENIKSASNGTYYYEASDELVKNLPDKLGLYDLIIEYGKDRVYSYDCITFDCSKASGDIEPEPEDVDAQSIKLKASKSEMNVAETLTVNASVIPAEAWKKDSHISYTVTPSDVLSVVLNADGKGFVAKALKPGHVTISAKLDGTTLTDSTNVSVYGVLSSSEKTALYNTLVNDYLVNPVVISDEQRTLSSVALPEGFTWKNPSDVISVDETDSIAYYEVVYNREGYVPYSVYAPVKISKIESVTVYGDEEVGSGHKDKYYFRYSYNGYRPTLLSQTWSVSGGAYIPSEVSVSENSVHVVFDGDGTVKVNLTFDGGITKQGELNVKVDKIKLKIKEEQPTKAVSKDSYTAYPDGSLFEIESDKLTAQKPNNQIALEAIGKFEKIQFISSDPNVASVDKNGVVTLKKPGVAVVTAKETEQNKGSMLFRIADFTPVLETKSFTVKQSENGGIVPINILPQNGNTITGIEIKEAIDGITPIFEDGTCKLKVSSFTAKKTVKPVLVIRTAKGSYEFPVTVTVDVTVPALRNFSFKQTVKPNVFYCGTKAENAVYTVTSKAYEIESITSKNADDIYVVDAFNVKTGELSLRPTNLTKTTVDTSYKVNAKKTVTLIVKVKGYDAVDVVVPVNVVLKKLSLKFSEVTVPETNKETTVSVISGKETVSSNGMTFITDAALTNNKVDVNITDLSGKAKLTYSSEKTSSYKAFVRHAGWTSDVTASGKVNYILQKDFKKLALTAERTSYTINTNPDYNNSVTIKLSVKNNPTLQLDSIKFDSTTNKSVTVKAVQGASDTFVVSVPDSKKFSAKIKFTGKYKDKDITPVNISISAVTALPGVNVSQKGRINIANRAGTATTLTPKLVNLPQSTVIEKVTIDEIKDAQNNSMEQLFDAELLGTTVKLTAKKGVNIKAVKHNVTFRFSLSEGPDLIKNITIAPENRLPKVTVKSMASIIYKTNVDKEAKYVLTVPNEYTIVGITPFVTEKDKTAEKFVIETDGNNILISLKKTEKTLKSQKYNVPFKVYIDGADKTKPITVKCAVTVK